MFLEGVVGRKREGIGIGIYKKKNVIKIKIKNKKNMFFNISKNFQTTLSIQN